MFKDRYGLTQAVLEGRKTMTRRIISKRDEDWFRMQYGEEYERWMRNTQFMYMEVLAVAQSYKSIAIELEKRGGKRTDKYFDKYYLARQMGRVSDTDAGWHNKMFVQAYLMPHHIRITDIKVERLQDISDGDCLKEGIKCFPSDVMPYLYTFDDIGCDKNWNTPQEAFARLIDEVSGKGTWNRNPFVFAYTFELVEKGGDQ